MLRKDSCLVFGAGTQASSSSSSSLHRFLQMHQEIAVVVGSSAVNENDGSKNQRVVDGKDIISYIPEGIIGHILSFLPTRDAVRTSVLSSRWKYNWTFITKLDFDDTLLYSPKRPQNFHLNFVNFVNRVLLHLADSRIHTFSLKLSAENTLHLSSWVSAIVAKKVQSLHIQAAKYISLSSCSLFYCNSLVKLVLDMDCTIKVPPSNRLSNLQFLRLSRVTFDNDSSTESKELVLNFPVLKVFEARQCIWYNVIIQAPLLESFYLEFFNYNVRSASSDEPLDTIKVCASHVSKFSYRGHLLEDFILLEPSIALNASADIFIEEYREQRMQQTSLRAFRLLKQFHEVECLKLAFGKYFVYAKGFFANLPVFGRLTYLQLDKVTAEALLDLLSKSPNLKTLVLNYATVRFDEKLFTSPMVPHCFLSSLEVVQIREFEQHHLSLAKFVLENAVVLEQMTISTFFMWRRSLVEMQNVKEELLSFPKSSNIAVIKFSLNVHDY